MPFDTLNLGGSEDDEFNIEQNRSRALSRLNLGKSRICSLRQVHGNKVCVAEEGSQEGDALITDKRNNVLAISMADCFPVLFYDDTNDIIAAAHSGWKGTLSEISASTVHAMKEMGSTATNIKVAIGQGISYGRFNVGNEVTEKFKNAGFPDTLIENHKIDLAGCIKHTLVETGILAENIWHMNRCTYEDDFFSFRRDAGATGRMWAVIAL